MEFSDVSRQGDENLDVMSHAPRYTRYIGQLVSRELPRAGRIMDIGAGNGQQTLNVINPSDEVLCIEPSLRQHESLRNLGYRVCADLESVDGGEFSAIFSLNCFEHVQNDSALLQSATALLKTGGRVVIFVPAMPLLFSSMDKKVGHFRRYTKSTLRELLHSAGLQVESVRYVDSIGAVLSLIYKLFPNADGEPSAGSMKLYDKMLLPLSRIIDILTHPFFGKNLLIVGNKR